MDEQTTPAQPETSAPAAMPVVAEAEPKKGSSWLTWLLVVVVIAAVVYVYFQYFR